MVFLFILNPSGPCSGSWRGPQPATALQLSEAGWVEDGQALTVLLRGELNVVCQGFTNN